MEILSVQLLERFRRSTPMSVSSKRTVRVNTSTRLTSTAKLPLTMLLCLVADGRQLTLDEIDRVLIYLFEKEATMLTLPEGTSPPLPVYYAKAIDNRDRVSTGTSTSHLLAKISLLS